MRLVLGTLSFDGHAGLGDFTGATTTVTGEMTGGESLAAVRGWVESPVKTLDTGNGKRDRDTAAVQLQGKLTLHGVTRDVTLPGQVWMDGGALRLCSDFPLDLGDYEIGGLTKMLGMLRMQEGIEVHVDLTFAPR
jgi:polyisoprenoid-binding protein YceI